MSAFLELFTVSYFSLSNTEPCALLERRVGGVVVLVRGRSSCRRFLRAMLVYRPRGKGAARPPPTSQYTHPCPPANSADSAAAVRTSQSLLRLVRWTGESGVLGRYFALKVSYLLLEAIV